MSISEFNQF